MKVAIALYGRAYNKTLSVLPYVGLDYHAFKLDDDGSHSLPTTVWRWAQQYLKKDLCHSISAFAPDVLYTNCAIATRGDVRAIYQLGIPIVVRLGGHIHKEEKENVAAGIIRGAASKVGYRLAHNLLIRATRLLVVSQDMATNLAAYLSRKPEDISVIPVPCNIEHFNLPKADDGRILIVTHLNFKPKVKALSDFLPALEHHANLRIIAPGRYNLNGVTGHKVSGFVDHIEREYQKASVFCYFSYLDGCPNVILEAWASHTPVIANRTGWSEELIRHGETGILVNNPEEAKAAVQNLLGDSTFRRRLADAGYKYVCSNHSPQMAGRILGRVLSH